MPAALLLALLVTVMWTTYGAAVGSAALVATGTLLVIASTLVISARLLFTPSR